MGHIGNVNPHFQVAVGQVQERKGIVKVAGIFGVDGKSGRFAHVAANRDFHFRYFRTECFCFLDDFGWKLQVEAIVDEDALHLNVVGSGFTEYVGQNPHGLAVLSGGPAFNFYHDAFFVFGPHEFGGINQDFQ